MSRNEHVNNGRPVIEATQINDMIKAILRPKKDALSLFPQTVWAH